MLWPMTKPASVEAYLESLPDAQRNALRKVRAQIKAAAPGAEEYLGYGMIGFRWLGHPLMYLGAASNHCALYGARADDALADKLKGYKQGKGTIQFAPDKPVPAPLVAEIVKARMAANEQRWGEKATAKRKAVKDAPKRKATKAVKAAPRSKATKAAPRRKATKAAPRRKVAREQP
jgi:uncharacterized protein YdhG (YjbR/CyaY superfamily)